ncbi:MAG: type I 3-dehydroquinate dehydratase [Thermoanaerobaculia bacterium]
MIDRIATIAEPTVPRALAALDDVAFWFDAAELRVDRIEDPLPEPAVFRKATRKDLIYTRRSEDGIARFNIAEAEDALQAGFERVDVEFGPAADRSFIARNRERIILSHHDYTGVPAELEELIAKMRATNAASIKVAVTPRSFADNLRLLRIQRDNADREDLTLFGMGTAGLYSRILAPFFGARLLFAAPGDTPAAPGQFPVEIAAQIYGPNRKLRRPEALFAVVGNPAANSLSPVVHNTIFREGRVPAAYATIETGHFEDVVALMAMGSDLAPTGISITAPYKELAFRLATDAGARIAENARDAAAVNTLVRTAEGFLADNTDVDGFETVLARLFQETRHAAVVGAGGTARAALVALRRCGYRATIFNRTMARAKALSIEYGAEVRDLAMLERFEGDVTINTIPASTGFELPASLVARERALIDVNYGPASDALAKRAIAALMPFVSGIGFLHAQAERQNALFVDAMEARI